MQQILKVTDNWGLDDWIMLKTHLVKGLHREIRIGTQSHGEESKSNRKLMQQIRQINSPNTAKMMIKDKSIRCCSIWSFQEMLMK